MRARAIFGVKEFEEAIEIFQLKYGPSLRLMDTRSRYICQLVYVTDSLLIHRGSKYVYENIGTT
jgi:hypothetical protein